MKILMIISEAPPIKSGMARVAEKLTQGLIKRGHTVDVLSANDIPRIEWGEIRISSMPVRLFKLKNQIKQYDLIHLHGVAPTFSDTFLLWWLRGLGKERPKLVYTYHAPIELNSILWRPILKIYNFLQEWMAGLADHVVVSTTSYAQRLSRYVPTHKLSVIPWGVEFSRYFAPLHRNGPFTVVYLGQVRPFKGLPVLLKAAEGVSDLRIWVIGSGNQLEACRKQAERLALSNVTFWGGLPDEETIGLLKQAHAIVLPSVNRSEAFGIALLEGMAAGLVPVASHLPGVADLVGNEGITFSPGNSLALRNILIRIKDDRELCLHLSNLAQMKARLYSWERVIFGYDHVFDRVVCQPESIDSLPAIPLPPPMRVKHEETLIER